MTHCCLTRGNTHTYSRCTPGLWVQEPPTPTHTPGERGRGPACRGCAGRGATSGLVGGAQRGLPAAHRPWERQRSPPPTAAERQGRTAVTPAAARSSLCKHAAGDVACSQMALPWLDHTGGVTARPHPADGSWTAGPPRTARWPVTVCACSCARVQAVLLHRVQDGKTEHTESSLPPH